MVITNDDIEFFKKAEETIKKGYYPSGQQAVGRYMTIFAEEIKNGTMRGNLSPKCGGCIKRGVKSAMQKIRELEKQMEDEQRVEREDNADQGTDKEG